ncbi:hypothetical protein E2C01_044727 [Portunus trituberculatus]|uniref:Uncharacterized protein n=1 Tax=Portunus trituberculatus TaxID=210409 RepID=A0A5B7FWC6_PORTR|nr:hypothetical protein [Portunus trituberculatus]
MVRQTRRGVPAVHLIDVGPAPALHRCVAEQVSPGTERCGPFTFRADVYSLGHLSSVHPDAGTLQVPGFSTWGSRTGDVHKISRST